MTREIVDKTGASSLLFMAIVAKLFTMGPRMLALKAGTAAWLVTFLAALVAWPGYLALSALLRRFPEKSLGQISKKVLGKSVGGLFCLVYVAFFLYLAGIFMREFEASFRIAILPRTPPSVLMLTFTGVVVFLVLKGVETICRMAAYLLPLLFGLCLLLSLGTLRLADFRYLLPFFGNGVNTTFLLPLPESSLYSEILALGALAGMLPTADVHGAGARALVRAALFMTGCFMLLGGVFPFPALSRLHFPMLDLARAIQVGEFVQRVEAIFVMLWFFFASFKVAAALSCAAIFFRDLAGLPDYRPLVFALALIAFTVAFLPPNTVVVAIVDSYTLRMWSWQVSYLLPAVTLGVAAWRARRGAGAHALPG